jgi:hypothetical protein
MLPRTGNEEKPLSSALCSAISRSWKTHLTNDHKAYEIIRNGAKIEAA